MIFDRILAILRRINHGIGLAVGVALALTVAFILLDIITRQLGRSLGGSTEISGYVMAATASWGLPFALMELAHVRIDFLRLRLHTWGRIVLDLLAIASLAVTVTVVAVQTWPVLGKSLQSNALANTPLATPLWIPQTIWFSGWVWFAVTACLMLLCAVGLLASGRLHAFDEQFGTFSEAEAKDDRSEDAT
ncbi:TRAP transporter small permease subunit [Fodinicurvata halophila]|uniref:TRAP transporter small permease protein n=1 Tax=Fodinicurvata halophila TaxID=1419723 RepID=A0ABV8UJ00_9PROT